MTRQTRPFHIFLLAVTWFLIHVLIFYYPGIRANLFDSKVYVEEADFFLSHGRFQESYHIFYSVPILAIAVCKLIAGDPVVCFVVFQSLLSAFAAIAMYRAAATLFNDQRAGLISAIIFLCWWDLIQWNTAVMTESIAGSIGCFVVLRLVKFQGRLTDFVTILFLLVLSLLTRPTGILFIFSTLIFVLIRYFNPLLTRRDFRIPSITALLAIGYLGISVMFSQWDLTEQYATGNVITYMHTIKGDPLYNESLRLDTTGLILPESDWSPLHKMGFFLWHNPVHFGMAAVLKIFYLLSGIRPYYSTLHNVFNLVWIGAVYVLFYVGVRRSRNIPINCYAIAMIIGNCLLISLAAVDWDNRFFLPMQPGIVLLAGGGAAAFYRSLATRFSDR